MRTLTKSGVTIMNALGVLCILLALLYISLLHTYQSPLPSDLIRYVFNDSWSIDSLAVMRSSFAIPPGYHLRECKSDSGWQVLGLVYARNKVHRALTIESVHLLDLPVDQPTDYSLHVQVSSGQDLRWPTLLWKEPFTIRISANHCQGVADSGFKNHTLRFEVRTDRGSIIVAPSVYLTGGRREYWERALQPWPQVAHPVTPGYESFYDNRHEL